MKTRVNSIFQLKITLRDSGPPIWRRVQVKEDMTLAQLHRVVQSVFGWENYHLHEFTIEGRTYGIPDPEFDDDRTVYDERDLRLKKVLPQVGFAFEYLYDFGDCWYHDLLLETILSPDPEVDYPVCIAGERSGPPEDVGGISGYFEYLAAIGDLRHPEHEAMIEWRGPFDSEEFSLGLVNLLLRKHFRSRKQRTVSAS